MLHTYYLTAENNYTQIIDGRAQFIALLNCETELRAKAINEQGRDVFDSKIYAGFKTPTESVFTRLTITASEPQKVELWVAMTPVGYDAPTKGANRSLSGVINHFGGTQKALPFERNRIATTLYSDEPFFYGGEGLTIENGIPVPAKTPVRVEGAGELHVAVFHGPDYEFSTEGERSILPYEPRLTDIWAFNGQYILSNSYSFGGYSYNHLLNVDTGDVAGVQCGLQSVPSEGLVTVVNSEFYTNTGGEFVRLDLNGGEGDVLVSSVHLVNSTAQYYDPDKQVFVIFTESAGVVKRFELTMGGALNDMGEMVGYTKIHGCIKAGNDHYLNDGGKLFKTDIDFANKVMVWEFASTEHKLQYSADWVVFGDKLAIRRVDNAVIGGQSYFMRAFASGSGLICVGATGDIYTTSDYQTFDKVFTQTEPFGTIWGAAMGEDAIYVLTPEFKLYTYKLVKAESTKQTIRILKESV